MAERWRGTVSTVETQERRGMTVTDDAITVGDMTRVQRGDFDLRGRATEGVLLPLSTTITLAAREGPHPARLQLRAVDPPSFDGIDWPADVREGIEAQQEKSAQARAGLQRQLGSVVAVTIAGLAVVLV